MHGHMNIKIVNRVITVWVHGHMVFVCVCVWGGACGSVHGTRGSTEIDTLIVIYAVTDANVGIFWCYVMYVMYPLHQQKVTQSTIAILSNSMVYI